MNSKGLIAMDIAGAKYDIFGIGTIFYVHDISYFLSRFLSENIKIICYPDGMVFLRCF